MDVWIEHCPDCGAAHRVTTDTYPRLAACVVCGHPIGGRA